MADIDLTVQQIIPTGLVVVHTGSLSIANTYKLRNDGRSFIRVVNGGGSPCNVTIATPRTVGGLAVADQSASVAAGTEENIGPFPPSIYNDSIGDVDITFDFITTVTVAALRV